MSEEDGQMDTVEDECTLLRRGLALRDASGSSAVSGLRESSKHAPCALPFTVAELGLVKLPDGSLLWGEDEVADNAETGEEAAELAPSCTWSSLELAARLSLPLTEAQSCGLPEEWVVGEPDVCLGLWWLDSVAQLSCAFLLSLVSGMTEVDVRTEAVDKEAEGGDGEDR